MSTYAEYPYRIFISYSQKDQATAKRLADYLQSELKLHPVWDRAIPGGWSFSEVIKRQIAHAHLFVPILTTDSRNSIWVNQEIGYAIGQNVPILPLSLDRLHRPEGMIAGIHAEVADEIDDLFPRLSRSKIANIVARAQTIGMHECADSVGARTAGIIRHGNEVETFFVGQGQRLRHWAAFGSFSLPSNPHDPLWNERYDGEEYKNQSQDRRDELSKERQLLEEYVQRFGCDLVLYPDLPHLSETAVKARIKELRSFLQTMNTVQADVRVAFHKSALGQNILIYGDWFCAESLTPKNEGYRHTTITCHAPTVLKQMEKFDSRFQVYQAMSADQAIDWLN